MKIFGKGMLRKLPYLGGKDQNSPPKDKDQNAHTKDPVLDKFYDDLLTGKYSEVTDPPARPWPALCHVKTDLDEGSGFLISEVTVVTAAHILCFAKQGKMINAQKIWIGLGDGPLKPASPDFHPPRIHPTYVELAQQVSLADPEDKARPELEVARDCYDFAAVLLDADPRPPFFLSPRSTGHDDPHWDGPLMTAGYPAAASGRMRSAAGTAYPYDSGRFMGGKNDLVVHNAATFKPKGQSGGPLFTRDRDGSVSVVGIQVRSNAGIIYNNKILYTNGAVRISQDVLDTLNGWDEDNKSFLALTKRQPDIIA